MTLKNNRAPLLCYFKLCASFHSHWWIRTGVTVQTPNLGQIRRFLEPCDPEISWMTLNQANLRDLMAATGLVMLLKMDSIVDFSARVTWKFDGWRAKIIGHLFYSTSRFSHHFKAISELKLDVQSGNAQFGSKSEIFVPCDFEIWWMTLKSNRAPLLCYVKLCAWFQSHCWIKTGVTVRKPSIEVKIDDFLVLCDLEIWQTTLKNNRAPVLCCFRLCTSFHSHQWIQSKVTVRKCLIWVKINNFFFLSPATFKFDGWPWKTRQIWGIW